MLNRSGRNWLATLIMAILIIGGCTLIFLSMRAGCTTIFHVLFD
jgi:hypothetical protein